MKRQFWDTWYINYVQLLYSRKCQGQYVVICNITQTFLEVKLFTAAYTWLRPIGAKIGYIGTAKDANDKRTCKLQVFLCNLLYDIFVISFCLNLLNDNKKEKYYFYINSHFISIHRSSCNFNKWDYQSNVLHRNQN